MRLTQWRAWYSLLLIESFGAVLIIIYILVAPSPIASLALSSRIGSRLLGISLIGSFVGMSIGVLVACRLMLSAAEHTTAQHRAALLTSDERYRFIVERSTDLIALTDADGYIHYASPSFAPTLGYDPVLAIGRSVFDQVHPDDIAETTARFVHAWREGAGETIVRLRHADGTWRWIAARGARMIENGCPTMVIVGHDISERKRLEADLMHMHRLGSVWHMTAAVIHDVNNLLTGIGGVATLSLQTLPPGDEVRNDLEAITHAAARASTLAGQLLSFARKPGFAPRALDLNELIRDLAQLVRRLLSTTIDCIIVPASDLGRVRGDPAQLEQILLNLALNARDAMPHGGTLTIETANVVLDGSTGLTWSDDHTGAYVRLTMRDTGSGMDGAIRARIFEPFFTTKAPGHSTGLGLSTCAEIIKRHSGSIQVDSEPGHGTTVTIYLPCALEDRAELALLVKGSRASQEYIDNQH